MSATRIGQDEYGATSSPEASSGSEESALMIAIVRQRLGLGDLEKGVNKPRPCASESACRPKRRDSAAKACLNHQKEQAESEKSRAIEEAVIEIERRSCNGGPENRKAEEQRASVTGALLSAEEEDRGGHHLQPRMLPTVGAVCVDGPHRVERNPLRKMTRASWKSQGSTTWWWQVP